MGLLFNWRMKPEEDKQGCKVLVNIYFQNISVFLFVNVHLHIDGASSRSIERHFFFLEGGLKALVKMDICLFWRCVWACQCDLEYLYTYKNYD